MLKSAKSEHMATRSAVQADSDSPKTLNLNPLNPLNPQTPTSEPLNPQTPKLINP